MRLRNRKSYITNLPEGRPPPDSRPRITQWIYFLAMFALLAYLGYVVFGRVAFVRGEGLVETKRVALSATRGGVVASVHVVPNQRILAGEPIAVISANQVCDASDNRDQERLQADIELDKLRVDDMRVELTRLQQQRSQLLGNEQLRRALEVGRDRGASAMDTREIERDVRKLERELRLRASELEVKRRRLGLMQEQVAARVQSTDCIDERVIAPFDARVLSVQRHANEYLARGETLAVLRPLPERAWVNGFFAEEDLTYLTDGKRMQVHFPNGFKSTAVIDLIRSADFAARDAQQRNAEPIYAPVQVRLVPATGNQHAMWLAHDRMNVQLKGVK